VQAAQGSGRPLWLVMMLCVVGAIAFAYASRDQGEDEALQVPVRPPRPAPIAVQPALPQSPTSPPRPSAAMPTRVDPPTAPEEAPDDPLAHAEAYVAAARARRAAEARERASAQVQIDLYSTSWCGYCKAARAWMAAHGIVYTDHDIERDAAAHDHMKAINPSGGVPTIEVDGQVLHGWSASNLEGAIASAIERRAAR
jgi:glutaredoxin